MKILFLIQSLARGGAERQVSLLARELRARGHEVAVAVFYPGGVFERDLVGAGVDVVSLEKRGRWDLIGFMSRLCRVLRHQWPDVLYTVMPVANLVGLVGRRLVPGPRLVWSARSAQLNLSDYDLLSRLTYWLEAKLSWQPNLVVVNSRAGRDLRVRQGFSATNLAVIPNGIDTKAFAPDSEGRAVLRRLWNYSETDIVVGLSARFDPVKGHETFLRAAAMAGGDNSRLRFLCVGGAVSDRQRTLQAMAHTLGIGDRVTWVEPRDDMRAVYNAMDIVTSASYGEGFANVIGEAMACAVPCVVTDVGDSGWIVEDTGEVVPPREPSALAAAWCRIAAMSREARTVLGARARTRIEREFSVAALVDNTLRAIETASR